MTLRVYTPDLISHRQNNSGDDENNLKRGKSMNDINNAINNINSDNNNSRKKISRNALLTASLTDSQSRILHRQVSQPSEFDIALELDHSGLKPPTPYLLREEEECISNSTLCFSPWRDPLFNNSNSYDGLDLQDIDGDDTDGTNSRHNSENPVSGVQQQQQQQNASQPDEMAVQEGLSETERLNNERRNHKWNELVQKHFPGHVGEMRVNDEFCHRIVCDLKEIADNFDQKQREVGGSVILKTFNISVTRAILPYCLRHHVVPALANLALNIALTYSRM